MFKSNQIKVTVTGKLMVARKYGYFKRIDCLSLQQSNCDSEGRIRRRDAELSISQVSFLTKF